MGGAYTLYFLNKVIILTLSVLFLIYTANRIFKKKSLYLPKSILPMLLLFTYALLQLIPLPVSILSILSPKGAYFAKINGHAFHPLSMAIPDTIYSILRLLSLIFFAIIIKNISLKKSWKMRMLFTLSLSGLFTVTINFIFKILDITELFGMSITEFQLYSSFIVNPNHLAGFLGITSISSLAMASDSNQRRKKVFFLTIFSLNMTGLFLTLSRGGIIAFIISIVILYTHKTLSHKKRVLKDRSFLKLWPKIDKRKKLLNTTFFFVFAMIIISTLAFSLLEKEYVSTQENPAGKLEHLPQAISYIKDFPLTGSGYGTFINVFQFYQKNPEHMFLQLEMEPLQIVLENGIIISAIFFLLFILMIDFKKGKRFNSFIFASLLFVLFQSLVDFNLHSFSTLIPFAALYSMITGEKRISGKLKYIYNFSALTFPVLMLIVLFTFEYDFKKVLPEKSYNEMVYDYPINYKVPLNESVNLINEKGNSYPLTGQMLSSMISKSPKYYFGYYLMGRFLISIGADKEAGLMYKKSINLSENRFYYLIKRIYKDLAIRKKGKLLIDILPYNNELHIDSMKKFFYTTLKDEKLLLYLTDHMKKEFAVVRGGVFQSLNNLENLENTVSYLEASFSKLSKMDKASFF